MAQQYIELVSTGKKTGVPTTNLVLDAVRLYYKSNGKIDAARNIRRVETATNKPASGIVRTHRIWHVAQK